MVMWLKQIIYENTGWTTDKAFRPLQEQYILWEEGTLFGLFDFFDLSDA